MPPSPSDLDYISKEDLLSVLASMKISLPQTTKIPADALYKKLRDAFHASQRTSELLPDGNTLDPRQLPAWEDPSDLEEAFDVHQRTIQGTFQRKLEDQLTESFRKLGLNVSKLQEDPKGETMHALQQILVWMAAHYKTGKTLFFLADEQIADWAVVIKVFGVYDAGDKTPVLVLSYTTLTDNAAKPLAKLIIDAVSVKDSSGNPCNDITRRTLLRLLQANAKLINPSYAPEGEANQKFLNKKRKWKLTFLFPLGAIPMADVGKLSVDAVCDVCGSTKGVSQCSNCMTVAYCSPGTDLPSSPYAGQLTAVEECQKSDWPRHKLRCDNLKGGTWTTINLGENPTSPVAGGGPLFMTNLNMHENLQSNSNTKTSRVGGTIPNTHGDKMFMVKFQVPGMGMSDPDHMYLYDQKRSFRAFWKQSEDPEAFEVGNRSLGGYPKMYRWARFVNGNTLSVCFDKAPAEMPPW